MADHIDINEFIELARSGNVDAMVMVADCYNRGSYVVQDQEQAHEWYKRAADHGHAGAQFFTALGYQSGTGTSPDPKLWYEYLRKAADQKHPYAQYYLALELHQNDHFVLRKDAKIMKLLTEAANSGLATAQQTLGDFYLMEYHNSGNIDEGIFWLAASGLHKDDVETAAESIERCEDLAQDPELRTKIQQTVAKIKEYYPQLTVNPSIG